MLVYLVAFLATFAIATVAEVRDRRLGTPSRLPRKFGFFGLLLAILLASISALRWGVGTDYWNYYLSFPRYIAEASEGIALWGEPGIRIIAWVVGKLGGDGIVMLGVAAAFTIGLTVRTIWRWSPALTFACAIYVLSGSWHGSFNAVRQYLAGAILLAGHRHIIERHYLRWVLVVAVASLFHNSALIGFLLYFVPRNRLSIPQQMAIIVLAALSLYGTSGLLEALDGVHEDDIGGSTYVLNEVNPLRVAFAFVPLLLHWFMPVPSSIREQNGWFYVNMLVIYAAGMLAMSGSVYLARFVIYPQLFLAIGLSYVTAYDDARERRIFRLILIFLFAIFSYVEISESNSLNEFTWVFDRDSFS